MATHVRPRDSCSNAPTACLGEIRPSSTVDLREAYALARGVAKVQAAAEPSPAGHRLVWIRRAALGSMTLAAADGAFAIAGRHTQCNVLLADDPFVALRHLLVRSIVLPSGGVALRALDLQTQLGFVLPDGSRHRSIFAEGPVAVGIGEYALVALPIDTLGAELPGELPAPEMIAPPAAREQLAALSNAMSPYRQNARGANRISRITLMPQPVMVGEPFPPSLGRLASGGSYVLTLEREHRSATIGLAEEDLARGAIVGRSEKCCSEHLRRITDVNTSRAHVLILREGPLVHAYDLASTQGTFVDGMRARRVVLADTGTALTLGRGSAAVRLLWHRTR